MASTLVSSSTLCFFIGPGKQSHRNRGGVLALPSVGSSHAKLRIRTIAWFGKRDKSAEEVEADRRKVQEFFEKIGRAERERVSKQLELERKATVQAERDYMIVRWWNKIFSKIFGKLRGTPWDPEPAHNISFSEFWKLLELGKVNYLDYADYGQQVAVILPYYEDTEGPIVKKGWKEKLEAERPIVYKRHIVEKMPADATTDVWSLLHKQLHDVQIFNTKSVPMHLYPQLHIAVVWTMRLAVAVCVYLLLDRILFPIYTVGDKERPREEKPSLTASSRPLGAFGESRARFISGEEKTGVTFEDFAGQNYVKRELKDVVKLLKQTKKDPKGLIATLVPRGVLLHGPPGTGKTLLAKAIAGEAGVPFFFASGSEFVEMFAGVAAARVQDLFSRAREFSPSIIFIDEIDAIGARRGGRDAGGGGAEREQGLVQMLTELDGFQKSDATVLLIGATNRIDILDPALLRKGRFDKILRVSTPTEEGRLEILKVHSRNKSFNSEQEKEMLLKEVAAGTKGYSGADLANIMNEAAILTIREDKDVIERSELLEAQDRQRGVFTTGQEDVLGVTREACVRVAYREAAVAVLDCYFPKQHSPFIKTNIKLIDGELNMRYVDPPFRVFGKKQDYIDAIVRRCAPRLVEEQVFGKDNVSWLSGSYLGEAGTLAEFLILQTGMTALGKISYDTDRDLVYNMHPKVQALRDEYMRYAIQKCSSVLREYHSAVETIADRLLEKKEIYDDEIWDIFNKAPRIPQPEVIPIDEYGALVYAGRWGIHGNSLPGRATFSPGNVGFVTFGAPRPKQVQLIKDETWKMMDALVKKNISKVREKVAKSGQPPVEEDMLLLPEHIL